MGSSQDKGGRGRDCGQTECLGERDRVRETSDIKRQDKKG